MHIGFIGLGAMGQPMALNLRRAGFTLTVFNRTVARTEPLRAAGAVVASSPAEVAEASDLIFLNVSDEAALSAVLFAEHGLAARLRAGSVVVDLGTTSPTTTRAFSERLVASGASWMDAPVSGGEAGAKAGTLSIMIGASDADFSRGLPALQAMGKQIVHVGPVGAGQVAKACNQIVVSATLIGVAEAVTFARQQGVDAAKVREALLGGFAYSRILETHGQRMLDETFTPGFKARLHLKDLNLVMNEATALRLPLPVTAQARQDMQALVDSGGGEQDSSAVIGVVGHGKPGL